MSDRYADLSIFRGKILEIKTLGWKRDETVKSLLTKAAKQVEPIMKKRGWTVPLLSEFVPESDNLLGLNINRGEEIRVRVRTPSSKNEFFDYNSILGTLLHELTHIACGPHNSDFYKLLDELESECEELISKGIFGHGFDTEGKRLGGSSKNPISKYQTREKAAMAAEQRMQTLMTSNPQRLGGTNQSDWKNKFPQRCAAQAALKRMQDEKWCETKVIDLTNDTEDTARLDPFVGNNTIDFSAPEDKESHSNRSVISFWSCPCILCFFSHLILCKSKFAFMINKQYALWKILHLLHHAMLVAF